jgi:hypothetical protein
MPAKAAWVMRHACAPRLKVEGVSAMRADRATLSHWRANAKQRFAVDVANPLPRGFIKHRQPLTSSGNRKCDYVS